MKLYVIENYKTIFPELKGSQLTDRLIGMCLGQTGGAASHECSVFTACIRRADGGKPFLDGELFEGVKTPHISVSHTGDIFALLVADCNVGLDIQIRKDLDAAKIAGRFFSPGEAELVADNPDEFFIIWTMKEAYAKYTGRGIGQVASGLDVMKLDDVEFREIKLDIGNKTEDCFCTVCAEKGASLDEIQISYRK